VISRRVIPLIFAVVALVFSGVAPEAYAGPATTAPGTMNDPNPSAQADPVPGTGVIDQFVAAKGQAFFDAQSKLDDFGTWIESQPGARGSGYLQQVNHPETMSIELLWHGHDGLLKKVQAEAAARGIRVTVVPRSFNAKQAEAAAASVWKHADKLAKQGIVVYGVAGISADTDAVVIDGAYTAGLATPANGQVTPKIQGNRKVVIDQEANAAGVPIVVREGAPIVPAAAAKPTRSTDYAPFKAGGYMISGTKICSTGFSVYRSGRTYATTARHCKPPTGTWKARNGTASYGSIVLNNAQTGMSLLSTTGQALMFDGKWNDAAGTTKSVQGVKDVRLGDLVCTGGGNSGVHCNIKVTQMAYSFNDGSGAFNNIKGVQQTAGQWAVIGGDSGGPVFAPGSKAGTVTAAGMIQAGTTESKSCGSVHDAGNYCGRTVLFSPIRTFLNQTGSLLLVR